MVSYIENESSIFSIIYDPVEDLFYHTHNNFIYKNFIEIKYSKYEKHIGFLGDHAKIYFKDYVSNPIEKKRSRSIGYDVLEVLEGKRSYMTIYGSKIWDLFPAMSFLKILNFKTNLPNMNFDYTKLDEKIIFYAEL
jgi:fructose-1,6-bisphosphatase/inositol monophosphatase family enzyme